METYSYQNSDIQAVRLTPEYPCIDLLHRGAISRKEILAHKCKTILSKFRALETNHSCEGFKKPRASYKE